MRLGLKRMRMRNRGDTFVEVIIAFAVLAAVLAGTISIMNLGIANAMRSLEITQVRQQIDSQAQALRYIQGAYTAEYDKDKPEPAVGPAKLWPMIRNTYALTGAEAPFSFSSTAGNCPTNVPTQLPKAFFVDPIPPSGVTDYMKLTPASTGLVLTPPSGSTLPPYAQIDYSATGSSKAYGMWVQAVLSPAGGATKYIDFHIRACWVGAGGNTPITLGTIVRLYDPKK